MVSRFLILLATLCAANIAAHADEKPLIELQPGEVITIGQSRYRVTVISDNTYARPLTEDDCLIVRGEGKFRIFDLGKGVEEPRRDCSWDIVEVSRDRRFAVIREKGATNTDLHAAIGNLETQKIMMRVPENCYADRWGFSGDYAVPLEGSRRLAILNLKTGTATDVPLPALKLEGATYIFSGWLDGDSHATFFIWSIQSTDAYRVSVPLQIPAKTTVAESPVSKFVKRLPDGPDGPQIVARIKPTYDGRPQSVAVVSTRTWEMLRKETDASDAGMFLLGTPSPDGKQIWYVDRHDGTTVYDTGTGKPLWHGPGDSFNAFTLGVVFGQGGKVALIASPYHGFFSVVRTNGLEEVGRYTIKEANAVKHVDPAGAMLIEPPKNTEVGELVIFGTQLPYE